MSFLEKLEQISAQLEKFYDQVIFFTRETISIEVAAILSTIIPCQNRSCQDFCALSIFTTWYKFS